jgi:hypothetical protein
MFDPTYFMRDKERTATAWLLGTARLLFPFVETNTRTDPSQALLEGLYYCCPFGMAGYRMV